ncbi:MAG: hypothetical protein ACI9S8_001500 [Chlamydiales bacterium]|jgi:hypothetical protein
MNQDKESLKWFTTVYLLAGTSKQREVWSILDRLQLLERLETYRPVLIGTLPIDIDVAGSDINIGCEVYDDRQLQEDLSLIFDSISFPKRDGYFLAHTYCDGFEIEFYGEPKPVSSQNGFRHMLVEARLLEFGGEKIKNDIREMKQKGIETEAAFARDLGLSGDPYQALLELEVSDDRELLNLCNKDILKAQGF